MSELRRRAVAVRRAILGPVWIVLIAGLVGITPCFSCCGLCVDDPWIVGLSLLVPVIMAAVAAWFRERTDRNRDRVGWLYCGWIVGKRRAVGIEDLDCAARARGLAVVIPECKEEFAYQFVAFAAEYLDRFADLTMNGSPWMPGMEQREECIESEGVEYAVLLSHNKLNVSLVQDEDMLVSLSRHALRQ